jgi:hypothetical protein
VIESFAIPPETSGAACQPIALTGILLVPLVCICSDLAQPMKIASFNINNITRRLTNLLE